MMSENCPIAISLNRITLVRTVIDDKTVPYLNLKDMSFLGMSIFHQELSKLKCLYEILTYNK